MGDTVILAEEISKHYVLGTIGSGSLRGDFSDWWHRKVARNDSLLPGISSNGAGNAKRSFWALDDINFDVKEGESLGIIGKNGAGKSTLLKILSRITKPTKGFV